eukprot:gnl/MRDRNA2_/MRDRNA2_77329_c0_seq1.p1 gnl/MRDRNA2_/MRDRNA2_77329_c0~~gnl/MRDRNA2_/MRDRNA2_77329_c0_seq1.p1  ORF type:complete len:473 (+),score=82.61 gnl/MRDRNA2_/MRDRNA2_77329_c0_seq1:155-1573(+)
MSKVIEALRVRTIGAVSSKTNVAKEVFKFVEKRDLRLLSQLLWRQRDLPWRRTWAENFDDPLELYSSASHCAADGRTPLMAALLATPRLQMAALLRQPSVLEELMKEGSETMRGLTAGRLLSASMHSSWAWGSAARDAAREWRQTAAMLFLNLAGHSLASMADTQNRTALHYAAASGDEVVVQELLRIGADSNALDSLGRTAAHFAAMRGHSALAKRLLKELHQQEREDAFGHSVPRILERHSEVWTCGVPRVKDLKTVPVVWEGGAARLPAMHRWGTPKSLSKALAGAKLSAGPVPYPSALGLQGRNVTLEELTNVKTYNTHESDAVPDYAFDVTLGQRVPELLGDAEVLPQDVRDEGWIAYMRYPQFGIGPAGAGAPMHVHFSAVNALFAGRKRWFLMHPSEAFWGITPSRQWAASSEYAELHKRGVLLEVVQNAGDVVFVPEGWGHATIVEEYGVGIGQEFIATSSINS